MGDHKNKFTINVTSTLEEETGKVKVDIISEAGCTRAMIAGTINALMEYFEEHNRDEWILALTKFLKNRGFD